jgi:3-deoxy-7-phosphoheptulonate synthase
MKSSSLSLVASKADTDMPYNTDDLRIRGIRELTPPAHLMREFPCTEASSATRDY